MTKTEELKYACISKGLRYVGTRGNLSGPICIVGEAPGADEDQAGVPFVGASGRELDRMLYEAGLDPTVCWWTNPYKVRPPDNKIDRLAELQIPRKLFEEQFFEELHVHKPVFIIALGATALGTLCPFTVASRTGHAPITKYAGSLLRSPYITWPHYVVANYHPAALFRSWSERPLCVLFLAKVAEEFKWWMQHGDIQPLPQRQLISDPPADDAIDFLQRILSSKSETPVSIDIENIGAYSGKYKTKARSRVPYVVGFSIDPKCGMSIGLSEYDFDKAKQIWHLINKVLATKRQVGQNYYTHDVPWLSYIGFDVSAVLIEDTLVRHHVLWPELSHKLEFQTAQYTREPYYKDEGKNWTVKERNKMKAYNCKDVCVTLEVYQRQEEELRARCA